MLKRFLGEAPFEVSLDDDIFLSPEKKCSAVLCFVNDTEYDYPLHCRLSMCSFVEVDKTAFDVTLPAFGNTSVTLVFSLPKDVKLCGGEKICELEITDGIFDSRSQYEFPIRCEMAFRCGNDEKCAFEKTNDILYSSKGTFFANAGEIISLEVPVSEARNVSLHIIHGQIKGFSDGTTVTLQEGLCRLCFEMEKDGSFEFYDEMTGERVFLDTLSPEYFI